MAPAGVVEPVDVLEDGSFRLPACRPFLAPDQFCLQRLEERLDGGVEAPTFVKRVSAVFQDGADARRFRGRCIVSGSG